MKLKEFCKKVKIDTGQTEWPPQVLLGLVEYDGDFVKIQTSRKQHVVNKKNILSIEDTDVVFRSGGE